MKCFHLRPPLYSVLLGCLVSSVLEGGRKYAKIGLATGVKIGGYAEKLAGTLMFSDNAHEVIAKNCSEELDKSDYILKRKRIETTHKIIHD